MLIHKSDQTEFTARVATVLTDEGVSIEGGMDTLESYVKATYPDLRKCLNLVQMNSQDGHLKVPGEADRGVGEWRLDCVELFKKGRVRDARALLCSQARPEEMDDIFRWLYDNLDLWGTTEEQQDEAIKIIRTGLVNHAVCADAEINLSATLIELGQLA